MQASLSFIFGCDRGMCAFTATENAVIVTEIIIWEVMQHRWSFSLHQITWLAKVAS